MQQAGRSGGGGFEGEALRPGWASSLGSLPHLNAAFAAELVLRHHPDLPAAPQLVRRSEAEGMLAQAVAGLPGVEANATGLTVDPAVFDPEARPVVDLTSDHWVGLAAFLHEVADRTHPIKIQLAGPITIALALHHAGVEAHHAARAAGGAIRAVMDALLTEVERRAPFAPLVVLLDEPGLTAWRSDAFPWAADDAIDLLSSALATATHRAVAGVHCCGRTEWRVALAAGPELLSLPVGAGVTEDPGVLSAFLDAGGWVAWGAVPTDGPVGANPDRYWVRLVEEWCELSRAGIDPVLLRRRALVTPACGLAGHGEAQAEVILGMTADIAARVQDQVTATRLSAGA